MACEWKHSTGHHQGGHRARAGAAKPSAWTKPTQNYAEPDAARRKDRKRRRFQKVGPTSSQHERARSVPQTEEAQNLEQLANTHVSRFLDEVVEAPAKRKAEGNDVAKKKESRYKEDNVFRSTSCVACFGAMSHTVSSTWMCVSAVDAARVRLWLDAKNVNAFPAMSGP